jgi:hypothetical protein
LHTHCSDNVEPISKNNSELALHCFPLRDSTDFFLFWLFKGKCSNFKTQD